MSDSIKSADRRLKLLLLLQSSKQLSVNKIADYFGVSRRTVFRDLRALQELDVPITHDMVEGYSLMKGYKVPPLMFNERELASIVLGLSFIKTQSDRSMSDDAKQVLLKIKSVIPPNLLQFFQSIEGNVITSPYFNSETESVKSTNWFAICQAISEKSSIQITYSSSTETSDRVIHPYYIVLYGDHWNVIGFDVNRSDIRNFKLSNIQQVQLLPERYKEIKKTKDELIYNFRESELKTYQIGIPVSLQNEFLNKFPGKVLSKHVEQSQLIISFVFDNDDWLATFLIPYIGKIAIVSDELKEYIQKKMQELSQLI